MLTALPSLDDMLARVRRLGAASPGSNQDLLVRGRADHFGSSGTFTWRFAPNDGWFVRSVEAGRSRTVGADAHGVWIREGDAPVRDLEWGDADQARLLAAVLGGGWLTASPRVERNVLSDSSLRLVCGRRDAVLTLDPATGEPRSLELRSSFATPSTWSFSGWEHFETVVFPTLVEERLPAGVVNRFEITSVTRERSEAKTFERPGAGTGTRLDERAAPEVPIERCPYGFLLVTPEIDGREAGPFIFDTGAGANVITPQAAARLGLPSIGSGWLGLAAGASSGTVRGAGSMRLGPLAIERPALVEMDLSALSEVAGVELAGILGYDVLRRAVVEIDVTGPHLAIRDPAAPPDLGNAWQPIAIYGNHVYVRARFEGHEGWFRLDTGAPQIPLIFNAPAVQELSLLEGRATTTARLGVPGGTMDAAIGKVEGLELAGHVFETLPALFPTESTGAFADRETIGNLGQECLRPFRVTFDYGRKRAAFVKRN